MLVYPCPGRSYGYDHHPWLRIQPDIQQQGAATCLTDLQSNFRFCFPLLFPPLLSFSFQEFPDPRSDSTFSKGRELFLEFPNCDCMDMFRCKFSNVLLFFSSKLIAFFILEFINLQTLLNTFDFFNCDTFRWIFL